MPSVSAAALAVPASGIRRIFELSAGRDDVIQLSVGEPDLPVAEHIRRAAADAWLRDATDYTPNSGILPLQQAISAKLRRDNGFEAGVDEIHVMPGGAAALFMGNRLALDHGDEILIPDPGYSTFAMAPSTVGAVAVPYQLDAERDFLPDFAVLEALVGERTRAILVNSPSNPLGVVWDRDVLEAVVAFAREHDLWIISDEVYEYFVWDGEHTSVARLAPERTLSVFSLSKSYALTGGRLGYLVTPPGLAERVRTLQEAFVSCVNEPMQWAALAAIDGGRQPIEAARSSFRESIDAALAVLDERGIRYQRPAGAFYLWIDVSHASGGDVAGWAERFLQDARVAVAPGSAFGEQGEGWIRVCAAVPSATLTTALSRLPSP